MGALIASVIRREFAWTSFENPRQTGRYLAGAGLMGIGGVLAGGCTLGAGLSGVPTLSIAALLAIGAIAAGAYATNRALNASSAERAESPTTPPLQPAE